MTAAVNQKADPTADTAVKDGSARSVQATLPKRVLRSDTAGTSLQYIDCEMWAGTYVCILATAVYRYLFVSDNTVVPDPADTAVNGGELGDVMGYWPADMPNFEIVSKAKPVLAIICDGEVYVTRK